MKNHMKINHSIQWIKIKQNQIFKIILGVGGDGLRGLPATTSLKMSLNVGK